MAIFSYISDLFLPRYCLVCGRQLFHFERHICTCCLYDLPRTFFWQYRYNKMAQQFNALLQQHIQREDLIYQMPVKYVYAVALFYYTGGSSYRQITRNLKYEYDIPSGRFFSRILVRYLRQCLFFADVDLVLPVPLHRWRLWKRGYNQASIIAKELADGMGWRYCDSLLRRRHYTRTQTKLSVEHKMRNVENAFQVDPRHISILSDGRPHHLVIVDDVFTTGATTYACYKALMDEIYARNLDFRQIRISLVTLGYVGN